MAMKRWASVGPPALRFGATPEAPQPAGRGRGLLAVLPMAAGPTEAAASHAQ
jgi:hypothetical protein